MIKNIYRIGDTGYYVVCALNTDRFISGHGDIKKTVKVIGQYGNNIKGCG